MRADGIRAVLLDALGTLVELVPPWPALVRELAARGVPVSEALAREAMRAEMAFYRAHHAEAGDAAGLADLRARCTGVLRDALGEPARGLGAAELQAALLASLRFVAYPEAARVLGALRAAACGWSSSATGTSRCTRCWPAPAWRPRRRRGHLGRGRRGQARPRDLRAPGSSWPAAWRLATRCTWATA